MIIEAIYFNELFFSYEKMKNEYLFPFILVFFHPEPEMEQTRDALRNAILPMPNPLSPFSLNLVPSLYSSGSSSVCSS